LWMVWRKEKQFVRVCYSCDEMCQRTKCNYNFNN
jgi:hypothetical protein